MSPLKTLPKPNLDLLRTFAILLVILDHILLAQRIAYAGSWSSAWIGVVGVYWFFVHTSLVLMWSLERKPHTLDFYIRRVFRIYPLVIAAVATAILFHAPVSKTSVNFFTSYSASPREILADCFLLQNVLFNNNLISVMWSLPLEVDMYFLLPVLFFFLRKNFSLWPLLILWCLAVLLGKADLLAGNNFFTVVPCFLPGVMAYVLFRRTNPRLPAWLFPAFLFVLCALFMRTPSVKASWPMCIALGIGVPFFRQISFAPLVRLSHEIAKYSYGIYLTHSFGLVIGFYLMPHQPRFLQIMVALSSTVALSVIAYHVVEKPMIDLGAKVAWKAEKRYEQKHLAEVI